MGDHKLKKMLELGIKATVNSDDPGYFQAYMNENFIEVARGIEPDEGRYYSIGA